MSKLEVHQKLAVVAHTCNPSPQKGCLQAPGPSGLHCERLPVKLVVFKQDEGEQVCGFRVRPETLGSPRVGILGFKEPPDVGAGK